MELKQALQNMKTNPNQENVNQLAKILLTTKIYAPAKWDKDPIADENGQLGFEADTKIELLIIQDENGKCYFPMFTNQEELLEWKPKQQSLLLSFEQWITFVDMAQNQIEGIVLNPTSEQIPLHQNFLDSLRKTRKATLTPNSLEAGKQLHLMNPEMNIDDMIESIQNTCKNIPDIEAVYVKERFEEDKASHWFILVQTQNRKTQYFEQIGQNLQGKTYGKSIEFMFANTQLAEKIIQNSKPVYEKK